jgi:hypothetical protein
MTVFIEVMIMTLLWVIAGSLESAQYFQGLEDEQPPRFKFVNRLAVYEYRRRVESAFHEYDDAEHERLWFNDMPMPIFRIADPAFRLDYFNTGLSCASLRLRHALGLTEAVIRYRDIDLDQSPPAVREQEYQAFHVLIVADPVDWSRTASVVLDVPRPDGSIRKQRYVAPPDPAGPPDRIYWRDDFKAPAPLFRAVGTPWTLATDSLADKVMRAGITDLAFLDITSDRAQTEIVFRQL